mmetsp:Transcript_33218/g.37032  ORF Transcript_33218/g.37032 Transcript_33218/m.37032 type:complete len:329 (+) Transcript_33218:81-1067(+)
MAIKKILSSSSLRRTSSSSVKRNKSSLSLDNESNNNNHASLNYTDLLYTDDMNLKIKHILSRLTTTELETAARSNYLYLKNPIPCERNRFARGLVERNIESNDGNVDVALKKIQKTLKFRQDIQIDDLITAFDKNNINNKVNDTNTAAEILGTHLSTKKFYVQGYDKEGRSTLYFIPRLVTNGHDNEWTLKEAIYSMERAIACSRQDTINAVVDFSEFSVSQHSPPMDIGKQFLTTLRNHYAGHIHCIFLINTPFSFSVLWNIFSPFIGTQTRDKIVIVKNNDDDVIRDLYDLEEIPSWFALGGKKNRPLDVDEYLYELPFDASFNDH